MGYLARASPCALDFQVLSRVRGVSQSQVTWRAPAPVRSIFKCSHALSEGSEPVPSQAWEVPSQAWE